MARRTVAAEVQRRCRCHERLDAPSGGRCAARPRHALADHIDQLFRAAWALCGSRHDAEDLVQETFLNVLKRPRFVRNRDEIGYLLRALRNTYASRYRKTAQRPASASCSRTTILLAPRHRACVNSREMMEAIASAPAQYRDAVIAVDLIGLSYREAARSLRTREATLTTRLHRGRQISPVCRRACGCRESRCVGAP